MKQRWTETPFNDFFGVMKDTRKAPMGSFEILKNLDLRGKSGDLEIRSGYAQKYDAISSSVLTNKKISNLTYVDTKNFWINSNGGREITVHITKQTVTAQTTLSPNTLNMIGIWIRPYWDGSSWVDEWHWLNEVILTKIDYTNISVGGIAYPGVMDIRYTLKSANELKNFSVLHYSGSDYDDPDQISGVIDCSDQGQSARIIIHDNANTWSQNDKVILIRNYIPIKTLTDGYENATKETISYHNVLDELRVCLGNTADQLAFGIGYKQKYWLNSAESLPYSVAEQVKNTNDRIILDPYNIITDYSLAHTYSDDVVSSGTFPNKRYFYVITGVLDGSQEFIIAPMYDGSQPNTFSTPNGSQNIRFTIKLLWGAFNKRMTGVKIYLSEGDSASTYKITNPFYLVGEYSISELDYSGSTPFATNSDGYLQIVDTIEYDDFQKASQTLTDLLGYGANVDYLRSWKDSLVIDNKAYFLNGYIDQEYKDKVFYSELNGAGSSMPDVVANSYFDYEYFNGNEVVGITKHPNSRIGLGRENSYKIVEKVYGIEAIGGEIRKGLVSKNAIANRGQDVIWASEFDVIRNQNHIIEDVSEGSIRGDYRAIVDKTAIIATVEKKENAFRFYDGVGTEYILTKKGWLTIDQYTDPDQYLISEDGTLWFTKNGKVFNQTGYVDRRHDAEVNNSITYQAKTMPIDIGLLSPKLKDTDTFYVNGVWIEYQKISASAPLTINTYLDGTLFSTEIFTDQSKAFHKLPLGAICKNFQIEVTGNNGGYFFAIHKMGVLWKPIKIGSKNGRNN